jgi:hypothetical protein
MSPLNVRSALKKNKMFFFTYKKLTDNDYRLNYLDYLTHAGKKSREKVRYELALIKDYWKCDPAIYFRYRLFEKNLTDEELLDYIPPFYFYNFYMPSLYGEKHVKLTGSKIKMNEFFTSKDIRTPEISAIIRNGRIYGTAQNKLEFRDLKKELLRKSTGAFFLKPDDGRGGKGIIKIERSGNELSVSKGVLDGKLLERLTADNTWVIQEGIKQRSDLNSIYPYSVNTLRVITQNFNNEPRIVAVVLRMGRNRSFVDNSSFGGVFAPVDIISGKISEQAGLLHDNTKFETHPDTGFRFRDFIITGWDKIKHDILAFAAKAPEFPDVAWDIAVLEDKITTIEINLNYGLDQLQCCMGGMRRRLNIEPLIYYNYKRIV